MPPAGHVPAQGAASPDAAPAMLGDATLGETLAAIAADQTPAEPAAMSSPAALALDKPEPKLFALFTQHDFKNVYGEADDNGLAEQGLLDVLGASGGLWGKQAGKMFDGRDESALGDFFKNRQKKNIVPAAQDMFYVKQGADKDAKAHRVTISVHNAGLRAKLDAVFACLDKSAPDELMKYPPPLPKFNEWVKLARADNGAPGLQVFDSNVEQTMDEARPASHASCRAAARPTTAPRAQLRVYSLVAAAATVPPADFDTQKKHGGRVQKNWAPLAPLCTSRERVLLLLRQIFKAKAEGTQGSCATVGVVWEFVFWLTIVRPECAEFAPELMSVQNNWRDIDAMNDNREEVRAPARCRTRPAPRRPLSCTSSCAPQVDPWAKAAKALRGVWEAVNHHLNQTPLSKNSPGASWIAIFKDVLETCGCPPFPAPAHRDARRPCLLTECASYRHSGDYCGCITTANDPEAALAEVLMAFKTAMPFITPEHWQQMHAPRPSNTITARHTANACRAAGSGGRAPTWTCRSRPGRRAATATPTKLPLVRAGRQGVPPQPGVQGDRDARLPQRAEAQPDHDGHGRARHRDAGLHGRHARHRRRAPARRLVIDRGADGHEHARDAQQTAPAGFLGQGVRWRSGAGGDRHRRARRQDRHHREAEARSRPARFDWRRRVRASEADQGQHSGRDGGALPRAGVILAACERLQERRSGPRARG